MKITFHKLQKIVSDSCYNTNGSETEKTHGKLLEELFPNSERFWKTFIVPFTNRIEKAICEYHKSITPRDGIADSLHELGSFHYSIFHNFIYAHAALHFRQPSYFENFYTHLGTICDCVEEFLIHLYFIILECTNSKSQVLQTLSNSEFIQLAKSWYDKNYSTLFEHYLSKGKSTRIPIPTNGFVLDEYFGNLSAWKDYVRFSQLVRQYRNVIVHNYSIAFFIDENQQHYVPKKNKIKEYKKWRDLEKAKANPSKFESDFIIREVQMQQDLDQMKLVLQALWEKPIADMTNLLFI